jgi:2-polyprenyl-3-methyl-5-hydroxy-6-metoxy-1,4-benzoquinol methylase
MSIEFYNVNSEVFISNTVRADMSKLYEKFEKHLKKKAVILDLGCGSGRDTRHFISKGYDVVSVDGSEKMVEYCKEHSTNEIYCSTFETFSSPMKFDAIWACASLLHVKRENIVKIISKYIDMLKNNGIFFMSFKLRKSDYSKDGRTFTCFTKDELIELISINYTVNLLDVIESTDVRENRDNEDWISVVIEV